MKIPLSKIIPVAITYHKTSSLSKQKGNTTTAFSAVSVFPSKYLFSFSATSYDPYLILGYSKNTQASDIDLRSHAEQLLILFQNRIHDGL